MTPERAVEMSCSELRSGVGGQSSFTHPRTSIDRAEPRLSAVTPGKLAMRRIISLAPVGVTIALFVAGCGSTPEGYLSTHDVVTSLRGAGFQQLRRYDYTAAVKKAVTTGQLPQSLGRNPMDYDLVWEQATSPWLSRVYGVRLPSVAQAKKTYAAGYSKAALGKTLAEMAAHPSLYAGLVPHDLKASDLRTARVCNVVLSSYNPTADQAVLRRFGRAVKLLQAACSQHEQN